MTYLPWGKMMVVPALDAAEQTAWDEMRAALVGLVERNRFV